MITTSLDPWAIIACICIMLYGVYLLADAYLVERSHERRAQWPGYHFPVEEEDNREN